MKGIFFAIFLMSDYIKCSFINPLSKRNPRLAILNRRLIGGKYTSSENWPFYSLLLGEKRCGGVLLSSNTILTSAKCLEKEYVTHAYLFYRKRNQQESRIISKILHPEYNSTLPLNNIGLAILEASVKLKKSQYAVISNYTEKIGTLYKLLGFGEYIDRNGLMKFPDKLQEINIKTTDKSHCYFAQQSFFATKSCLSEEKSEIFKNICKTKCGGIKIREEERYPICINQCYINPYYRDTCVSMTVAQGQTPIYNHSSSHKIYCATFADNLQTPYISDLGGPTINNRNQVVGVVSILYDNEHDSLDLTSVFTDVSYYRTWIEESIKNYTLNERGNSTSNSSQ